MFDPGKHYLNIYDHFYLSCSGVCKVHFYTRDSGGKNELQI